MSDKSVVLRATMAPADGLAEFVAGLAERGHAAEVIVDITLACLRVAMAADTCQFVQVTEASPVPRAVAGNGFAGINEMLVSPDDSIDGSPRGNGAGVADRTDGRESSLLNDADRGDDLSIASTLRVPIRRAGKIEAMVELHCRASRVFTAAEAQLVERLGTMLHSLPIRGGSSCAVNRGSSRSVAG